jgi:hypothetical protein
MEGLCICFFADVRSGTVLPCFCFWTDVRLGAVLPGVWLGTLVLRTVFPRAWLGTNGRLRTVLPSAWFSSSLQRRGGLKNFAIITRDGAFEELRCLVHALLLLSGISNVIRSPAAKQRLSTIAAIFLFRPEPWSLPPASRHRKLSDAAASA